MSRESKAGPSEKADWVLAVVAGLMVLVASAVMKGAETVLWLDAGLVTEDAA